LRHPGNPERSKHAQKEQDGRNVPIPNSDFTVGGKDVYDKKGCNHSKGVRDTGNFRDITIFQKRRIYKGLWIKPLLQGKGFRLRGQGGGFEEPPTVLSSFTGIRTTKRYTAPEKGKSSSQNEEEKRDRSRHRINLGNVGGRRK